MNSTVQVGDTVQVTSGSKRNATGVVTFIGETHTSKWSVAHVRCLCGDTFTTGLSVIKVITKGEDNG